MHAMAVYLQGSLLFDLIQSQTTGCFLRWLFFALMGGKEEIKWLTK